MIRRSSLLFAMCLIFCGSVIAETTPEDLVANEETWFKSDEGEKTLDYILSWQSDHGDWPKNSDTIREAYTGDRKKLKGTFDNGATVGELRVLGRAFVVTGDSRYQEAFLRGFDHILKAQYSNGGWPQYYPLSKDYPRHITFNDNSMVRLLEFVRDCGSSAEFAFLDAQRRQAATEAFNRGIDCVLKCQVNVNGTPTVWCAQHDEVTLAPTSARSYELASLSGGESAGILKLLISIDHPSPELIQCVKDGVAWFESAKITGFRYQRSSDKPNLVADDGARPLWARFYELESNRPFFCDRDGVVKYDIEEIGDERRGGYSWYGNWGESLLNAYKKWPHR